MSEWQEFERAFIDNQLMVPPIPDSYRRSLRQVDDMHWSTWSEVNPLDLYMVKPSIEGVVAGQVAPGVSIGVLGHGDNSHAVTFHLVSGCAAIFLQVGIGPVYTDFAQSRIRVAKAFILLSRLIRSIPNTNENLEHVVAFSDFRGIALLLQLVRGIGESSESYPGWSEVDYRSLASSDGHKATLDGGLFEWNEPIRFELASSKFLCDLDPKGFV